MLSPPSCQPNYNPQMNTQQAGLNTKIKTWKKPDMEQLRTIFAPSCCTLQMQLLLSDFPQLDETRNQRKLGCFEH